MEMSNGRLLAGLQNVGAGATAKIVVCPRLFSPIIFRSLGILRHDTDVYLDDTASLPRTLPELGARSEVSHYV